MSEWHKSTKIIHKSCRRWRPHNLSMATSRVGFSGGPSGHSRRGCGRQTCQMCIAGAKWLPVILIMAIVSWSYYAYIVHLCVFTVLNEAGTIEAIILATIYHLFLVPFIASYWKTVWTHPGKVNVTFRIAIMIIIHFFSGATKLCFNYLWSRYHWICLWTPKSFRKSSRQQGFGSVDAFHARRNPLLFWVLTYQTWPMSSLLHVQWMCSQNGSPLPLGQQLCGILQPKVLFLVFGLRLLLLYVCHVVDAQVFHRLLVTRRHDIFQWKVSQTFWRYFFITLVHVFLFFQIPCHFSVLRQWDVRRQSVIPLWLPYLPDLAKSYNFRSIQTPILSQRLGRPKRILPGQGQQLSWSAWRSANAMVRSGVYQFRRRLDLPKAGYGWGRRIFWRVWKWLEQ